MVSGPEVAAALSEWVADENERKRTQVERTATELKAKALCHPSLPRDFSLSNTMEEKTMEVQTPPLSSESVTIQQAIDESSALVVAASLPGIPRFQSSTLGNVSGQDLAREVRALLIKKASDDAIQQQILQQQQVQSQKQLQLQSQQQQPLTEPLSTVNSSCESSVSSDPKVVNHNAYKISPCASSSNVFRLSKPSGQVFAGIEQVARKSLNREAANKDAIENVIPSSNTNPAGIRRVLRWHALVDSGMGRLGFRTDPVQDGEDRRDTVDVIRQLVDCEIHYNAPIEFYGMCTHMADACSTSDYTHEQVAKFISLLKRVRDVNIFIPTVSTDNSAALLTSNLTHFDPNEILSQEHSNTRGYVRTGGAIYGQRPAFSQLRSVSTLLASVRHVAILRKGESVGYDRAYTAPYDVRIATLTVGFADGYPRELGNGIGKVAIRGSVFPVAGNVCMDMMMVELGPVDDLAGAGASVAVRDTAVLWGPMDEEEEDGLVRLQDLAVTLNTTQSALTCGLDKMRVRRQFV
jgi:alanine racemase